MEFCGVCGGDAVVELGSEEAVAQWREGGERRKQRWRAQAGVSVPCVGLSAFIHIYCTCRVSETWIQK